jgi:hypothetical protein
MVNVENASLIGCSDEVFNMDCLKQRLQKNMDDRRREVDARQLEQRQELKLIQEELHNLIIKRKNCVLFIEKVHCEQFLYR